MMKNWISRPAALALSAALITSTVSAPASAGLKDMFKKEGTAQEQRKEGVAQIPTCAKPLGSISVFEPEDAVNPAAAGAVQADQGVGQQVALLHPGRSWRRHGRSPVRA